MDTIKVNHGTTKMVAHRGVSKLELENTAAAFIAAGNRSYFGVETDVHVTSDSKFVVIHDDSTGRVEGKGKCAGITVEKSTADEISKRRLKSLYGKARADLVIPMLEDYIEICKYYDKTCVLEIKNEFSRDALIAMTEEIRSLGYLEHVIFISFKESNLKLLREMLPDQKLQFLCGELTDGVLAMMDEYNFDLDIRHSGLSREVIDKVHAHGHIVNTWTVDDADRATELIAWGVDQITTNILE